MEKRNFIFKSIAFVLCGFLFFFTNVNAQVLKAGFADNSTAVSTSISNTWQTVNSVSLPSLTGTNTVMVISNFNIISEGKQDITGQYKLTDGTTSSREVSRYIATKSYTDYGLGAVINIFENTTATSFSLQHQSPVAGAAKVISSKANMVAIVIDDTNITLPYAVKTSTSNDETTSSTSYVQIPGLHTNSFTLSTNDAVYLSTAFSTLNGGNCGYAIRYSSNSGSSWTTLSEISRSNSSNVGSATITSMFIAPGAGNYIFDIAHKAGSGTLTTRNITFIAVGLKDSNGNVYPAYKSTGLSGGPITTITPTQIPGPSVNSNNAYNSVFTHCTFNVTNNSGTDLETAGVKLSITNSDFAPLIFNRYILAGKTGSGGLVGLATGINYNTSSVISLYHNSDGTQSLTTNNVSIVGFQLKSTPKVIAGGDWGIAGDWTPNGVPAAKDNVLVSGTAISSETASCNDLLISVTGSLTNSGTINLAAGGIFTIHSDATNSGSFIQNGTYSGNITYNRFMTSIDWHLISSPVGGQDINSLVVSNLATNSIAFQSPKYGLAPYDNTIPAWVHFTTSNIGSAGNFTPGKGYEVLRTSDGTVVFTGTVATNDVSIGITNNTNGWNLIGNPFPSAIMGNISADPTDNFISVNTAALEDAYEAIYVWDAATSAYLTVNQASGAFYLAPGQAFFAYSVAGGSTVNFTEAMQTHQTGDIFKSDEIPTPSIKLLAERNESISSTNILYLNNMTAGLDPGYDAGRFSGGNNSFAVYTHLAGDNTNLVDFDIQCLPANQYDLIIPVGLNAPANTEIIFSAEITNMPITAPVYLEDKLTNTFTALHEPGGLYNIRTDAKSEGTGRFFLHTQSSLTGIGPLANESDFNIIPHPENNMIRVTGSFNNNSTIAVYDMAGRKMINRKLSSSGINDVKMDKLRSGIYVVLINSSTQNKIKKISWIRNN